jgi:hypothetical protein
MAMRRKIVRLKGRHAEKSRHAEKTERVERSPVKAFLISQNGSLLSLTAK